MCAGHTLMGYVVAGEVRGCSKDRGGCALLRLDLLTAVRERQVTLSFPPLSCSLR